MVKRLPRRPRRRRRLPRSLARRALRCPLRRVDRDCLRSMPGYRRGADDLAQALTAFRRALTCHRRLARLAPRFFDATVVDRERRERADQRRWMALWEPALAKAYGCEPAPAPSDPTADLPPLPSRRTQRAVERELAAWDLWMAAGRLALDRHHQRRPHALMSFTGLARLLQLALDFRRLACGQPAPPEISFDARYANFMADLERAYGPASTSADLDSLLTPTPHIVA